MAMNKSFAFILFKISIVSEISGLIMRNSNESNRYI